VASAATKVGPKFQVTIPKNVRDAVGLKVGDLVEASVGRDGIVLRQKVLIDKPVSLARQLEESDAAVKAGRVLGPFKSSGAAMKAVKAHARRAGRTVRR
jgi:AbrB family looped-hinge helix DNA binding protein